MGLPAASYLSNATRTVAEMKDGLENQRDFIADLLGGSARNKLTIAGGVITPPDGSSGGVHTIETEALAAADDLATVSLTNVPDGRILIFYADNASRVVTLKHAAGGAGQFVLRDSVDVVLDALDKWVMCQRRGNDLVEMARGYGVDHYRMQDDARIAQLVSHNTLCPHSRLRLDYASAATVTVAADAVVLYDSAGHARRFNSLSETLNVANTGANGRDVIDNAGAEQASAWYHVFAIGKSDGTLDVFASQVGYPGSVTDIYGRLPSGYTFAGYLGAIRNDSGSNLVPFKQRGDAAVRNLVTALSAGTSATAASISLADVIPVTARRTRGVAFVLSLSGTIACNASMYSETSNSLGAESIFVPSVGTGNGAGGSFNLDIVTAQTIWYLVSAGGSLTIQVSGWQY